MSKDRRRARLEILTDFAVLGISVLWLARLGAQAAGARYQTDECFHAYMSEWFASHVTLPRTIPELYSGFAYYYPPLFHVLGGLWVRLFGEISLRFLNVFVSGALLVTLSFGCRSLGVRSAGGWAVALSVTSSLLSLHAVRLYVEQLTALLAAGAVLLVLRVRQTRSRPAAIALGVTTGLALLAKHSALVLVAGVLVMAVFYALRRESKLARAYGLAVAIALLVAAPMFVRNSVLYGSPIYPALAADVHPLLNALNRATFTPPPHELYADVARGMGIPLGAAVVAALVLPALRRRGSLELGLLAACVILIAIGPMQPFLDTRHMLPVLVLMALLASIVLTRELAHRPAMSAAIGVVLLATAAGSPLPNYRALLDQSRAGEAAFRAVREHVPAGEAVLSLYTYDTFYYSRRAATWPIPWGQKDPPVEMFLTSDCDSMLLALKRHRLRWILAPRDPQGETFNGANYPRAFVTCLAMLVAQRRVSVPWHSESAALVRVEEP